MPRSFVELSPQNFSFNSPLGWCPACEGLGVERGTNQETLIPNPNLSLREGAISVWPQPKSNPVFLRMLVAIGEQLNIPIDGPWYQIDPRKRRVVRYGSEAWVECEWPVRQGSGVRDQESEDKGTRRQGDKERKGAKSSQTAGPTATVRFQYKGLYP